MASPAEARRANVALNIRAIAPHATEMQAAIAVRVCASGNPGRRAAPMTSATAHHVSHATGGCIRPGGSRAVRRSRFVASLRMLSMSRDPSDEPRAIRSVRPNFAQLSQCSAMSRIPLA